MTAGTGDGDKTMRMNTSDPSAHPGLRLNTSDDASHGFTPDMFEESKPQPQGAPTAEAPRCPHLQCTVDEYWNHEYGQELVKNRRILAAIRDDALANEIVQDTVLPKEAIFAYRAALLEHINAKENPNG